MVSLRSTPKLGVAGTLLFVALGGKGSEEHGAAVLSGEVEMASVNKRGLRITGRAFANRTAPPAAMCYVSPVTILSKSFGEESLGTQLTSSLGDSDMADVGKNHC